MAPDKNDLVTLPLYRLEINSQHAVGNRVVVQSIERTRLVHVS